MDELPKVSRQKYWSEVGIEEKIERIREEVKRLQSKVMVLGELVERLSTHKHLDNEMVISFRESRKFWELETHHIVPNKDDVYF